MSEASSSWGIEAGSDSFPSGTCRVALPLSIPFGPKKAVVVLVLCLPGDTVVLHCGTRINSSSTRHSMPKSMVVTALYVCSMHQCGHSQVFERAHVVYTSPQGVHYSALLGLLQRKYDIEIFAKSSRRLFGERL